jgi:ankyrin repeat protein
MIPPKRKRVLPSSPSIEQHKKQAKELRRAYRDGDAASGARLRAALPRLRDLTDAQLLEAPLTLSDAQFVIAREHGFESWAKFKRHVETLAAEHRARVQDFLSAATPNPAEDHRAGTALRATELLNEYPDLAEADIFAASASGNVDAVAGHLAQDSGLAGKRGGPHDWEPIQYVCFSRFLREHPERTEAFVRTARILLEHGANANAYFDSNGETETVLYGAGGVARNPALTRLLLEAGADANDADLEYHAAEYPDPTCLMLMVEYGLDLNRTGTSLLRKLDFEEPDNVRLLLEAGANPNAGLETWGKNALHQAVIRGRSIEIVRLLIDYGADIEARTREGKTAYSLAARRGRADIMDLLRERVADVQLDPIDRLLAACGRTDEAEVRAVLTENPNLMRSISPADVRAIVDAAGAGLTAAVRIMLDAGFPIIGPGDGAPTPLHEAAWYGHADTVALLLERGAPTDILEGRYSGTPLQWALHASRAHPERAELQAVVIGLLRARHG